MPTDTSPLSIVVLAAGKGTRMKSPLKKVLHPIGNRPLLGHAIHHAMQLEPAELITVTSPNATEIANCATSFGATAIVEQAEQLGTGHAVNCAMEKVTQRTGTLLVIYGDTPFLSAKTLSQLLQARQDNDAAIAVLGFEPDDAGAYGRLVGEEDGTLHRIVEFNEADASERAITRCNAGVMALDLEHAASLLNTIDNQNAKQEYYLTDAVGIARDHGLSACFSLADPSEVRGVNSQSELAEAEGWFQKQQRHTLLEAGVTLVDPATVYLSADTQIAAGTRIEPNIWFGPNVTVGECCHIKAFSHIEGAQVGDHCTVGPFARLRPGAELADSVKIGNFVEVKASKLAKGVKAGHLSYIGDSEIGEETNIGAGTVTCNYDGTNKHKTVIGKDSFIGSNTALVAPVTLGNNVTVAAGSTITEDAPNNSLAIARSKQNNKADYK